MKRSLVSLLLLPLLVSGALLCSDSRVPGGEPVEHRAAYRIIEAGGAEPGEVSFWVAAVSDVIKDALFVSSCGYYSPLNVAILQGQRRTVRRTDLVLNVASSRVEEVLVSGVQIDALVGDRPHVIRIWPDGYQVTEGDLSIELEWSLRAILLAAKDREDKLRLYQLNASGNYSDIGLAVIDNYMRLPYHVRLAGKTAFLAAIALRLKGAAVALDPIDPRELSENKTLKTMIESEEYTSDGIKFLRAYRALPRTIRLACEGAFSAEIARHKK
ncbi:MAG: hypothetical protein QG604_54 [Candidatus Dependentiae bacterium]|nr:hypothetical protein [Candidatus Dependentiae bacterium]